MRILALDIATKTGFAVTDGESGTWNFTAKKDESKGLRLVLLKRNIARIHKEEPIDIVVFEAVRCTRNVQAVVAQSELQGIVKAWCEIKGIVYKGYTSSTIKKHATGKGNADKKAMVNSAAEFFETTIVDDNHADALWLLDLATIELDSEGEFE